MDGFFFDEHLEITWDIFICSIPPVKVSAWLTAHRLK